MLAPLDLEPDDLIKHALDQPVVATITYDARHPRDARRGTLTGYLAGQLTSVSPELPHLIAVLDPTTGRTRASVRLADLIDVIRLDPDDDTRERAIGAVMRAADERIDAEYADDPHPHSFT